MEPENRKYSDRIPYTGISGIVFQWSQIRNFFLSAFSLLGWLQALPVGLKAKSFLGMLASFGADVTQWLYEDVEQ